MTPGRGADAEQANWEERGTMSIHPLNDEIETAQDYLVEGCLSMLDRGAPREEWFREIRRVETASGPFWPRNAMLLDFTLARATCAVAEVCAAPHGFDHGKCGSFVDAVARGDSMGAEARWRLRNEQRVSRSGGTLATYTDALVRSLSAYDVAGARDRVAGAMPQEYLPTQQTS
jgi:hypothetical protein